MGSVSLRPANDKIRSMVDHETAKALGLDLPAGVRRL
jgi:hypothetical protein